jgi:transcriptional regulator with XRE-family HTH domain
MRRTVRDKVALLATRYTQKQIAEKLGVSTRTVRRWKNENVQPARVQTEAKLRSLAASVRKTLQAQARKARAPLPNVPVPPKARRVLRLDPSDPKLVRRIDSDTVSYDVRGMSMQDIRAILRWLRDRDRIVRVIYKIPKGGTSLGGRDYLKGGQSSTEWEADFGMFTDDEIDAWMGDLFAGHRRMLYIMVAD